MTEQNETKTGSISIDEPTTREVMDYYRINHDELVRYIKGLGIEQNDAGNLKGHGDEIPS